MTWTCEKCGLQVDDKHVPNNCDGVKDQPHTWEETWWHIKKLETAKWQNWLDSDDSLDWKNKYTHIKAVMNEVVENTQKNYVNELESGKDKFQKTWDRIATLSGDAFSVQSH